MLVRGTVVRPAVGGNGASTAVIRRGPGLHARQHEGSRPRAHHESARCRVRLVSPRQLPLGGPVPRRSSGSPSTTSPTSSATRACVFWELDPVAPAARSRPATRRSRRRPGSRRRCCEWGSLRKGRATSTRAGRVRDVRAAGVRRRARSAFPTSPVCADAVLLMTAHVLPEFTGRWARPDADAGGGQGPGRARGISAIEAFGDTAPQDGSGAVAQLRAAGRPPARGGLQDRAAAPPLPAAADGAALGAVLARRRRGGAGEAARRRCCPGRPRPARADQCHASARREAG